MLATWFLLALAAATAEAGGRKSDYYTAFPGDVPDDGPRIKKAVLIDGDTSGMLWR